MKVQACLMLASRLKNAAMENLYNNSQVKMPAINVNCELESVL